MSSLFHGYTKLRSGDLTLLYKDGEIRHLCLGRIQVLNAIYAAVRDQNWTTIPFKVVHETLEESQNGFSIKIDLKYSMEEIIYQAKISIEAKGKRLFVNYDGEAGSSFLRNRIGLCILHPIKECRGKKVLITHPDGSQSEESFPELISPHQPFLKISGMKWSPGEGISAELDFYGEIFESEDQRNWTDASYKTYSTPLDLPFPVKVEKGENVHQSVSLVVETKNRTNSPHPEKRILTLHPYKTSALPGLGIGRSAEEEPLTPEESEILSTLPFHHYRVDLHLSRNGWKDVYDSAVNEQQQLGWPLELALHFGKYPAGELEAFLQHFTIFPAEIHHFLVFDQDFLSSNELLTLVGPRLNAVFPGKAVGGGTDANFAELNRFPPDPELLDFVSYSICPQIHAFDRLSLLENLEAQPESVKSARSLLNKPVSIGALSMKQRFNAVAANDEYDSQARPESDPRQHTSFTAAWTLSSIRSLALCGAASLTYFETVGPRGILSRKDSAERHSPLFQLFNEVLKEQQIQVTQTESSHPLEFDCLALKGKKNFKLLLVNFTETELTIEIKGMPGIPRKLSLEPSEITKITCTL